VVIGLLKTEIIHLSLRREVDKIALLRLEDSARTPKDFEGVIKEWNRIDRNRRRRERRYEVRRPSAEMLHWDKMNEGDEKGRLRAELETVIPPPLDHAWWRQLQSGNFIDKIFDCPHEIAELTSHKKVSLAIKTLKAEQKEILYYRAIRQWSSQKLAVYRGQSDRNIRKVYATLISKIHKEMEKIEDEKPVSEDELALDTLRRICREKD